MKTTPSLTMLLKRWPDVCSRRSVLISRAKKDSASLPNGNLSETPKHYPTGRRSLTKPSGAPGRARRGAGAILLLCFSQIFLPAGTKFCNETLRNVVYGAIFFSGQGSRSHTATRGVQRVWAAPSEHRMPSVYRHALLAT